MSSALPKLAQIVDPIRECETESTHTTRGSGLDRLLSSVRREGRSEEVRIAEYAPFPRSQADQHIRLGFTRDVSPLGMCLGVDARESVGSLLRVEVRKLDGSTMGASVARVVWCKETRDDRYWLGLDLLCRTDGGSTETERLVGAARDSDDAQAI